MRILFLSASVGVGHTAAAKAVAAAARQIDPNVEIETVDSYRYAASVFSKVVADGYIGMVKTVPQLYRLIYDRAERASEAGAFRRWVGRYTAANLRPLLESRRPDVVVCTHAFPCGVMSEYKKAYDPTLPVVGIVTDFVVHPFWIYRNVDAYAVPTKEMRGTIAARGVARDRVLVSGIPVDPRFARPLRSRDEVRRELGLPLDRRVVLMMGGGLGIGPLDQMMDALGTLDVPIAGAIIVGRNQRLERRVLERAARTEYPLRVVGFVDNVFDYMHAADLLLTKPGGLTSSEALAAGLPMVLVRPLPGQEERNTRYLTGRGAAIRARDRRDLAKIVAGVLGSESQIEEMRRTAAALGHPDAAYRVAELLREVARSSPANMSPSPTPASAGERWPSG